MESPVKKRMMIVSNWKSWGTISVIKELCTLLLNKLVYDPTKIEMVVAPGFLHIPLVRALLSDHIEVSAQDVSPEKNGEFTGEISAKLLLEHKVKWVILGHSERRDKFGEKDELIKRKMEMVMANGLHAILCVGEKLEEKEENKTDEVIDRQLMAVKDAITAWDHVAIAYEPIWTFNTGRSISPDQAQDSVDIVRRWVKANVPPEEAGGVRFLYGGILSEKSASTFLELEELDGLLVGSKSTEPKFRDLFDYCSKIQKYN